MALFCFKHDPSASNMTSGKLTNWCLAEEAEIENLEVEWFKNHFGEQNYTGQQLDSITDPKIKNYEDKCYPSTYQSRTVDELMDKVGKD